MIPCKGCKNNCVGQPDPIDKVWSPYSRQWIDKRPTKEEALLESLKKLVKEFKE